MSHGEPFELLNLVLGNEILWLDDPGQQFGLMTLICSDAFHLRNNIPLNIREKMRSRATLVLHPQLCSKPLQSSFSSYRGVIFGEQRIGDFAQTIALNWALSTRIEDDPFFTNGHYPASSIRQKRSVQVQVADVFNRNFKRGLYHHLNDGDRWDVFTFHSEPGEFLVRLNRNPGTEHEANTNGYPEVLAVGKVTEPTPDACGFFTRNGIYVPDAVNQLNPLERESFVTVAVTKSLLAAPELLPVNIPGCKSDRDVPELIAFCPGGDNRADTQREERVIRLNQFDNEILSRRDLWAPPFTTFNTIEFNKDYRNGPATLVCDASTPAIGVFIGDGTTIRATKLRDDLEVFAGDEFPGLEKLICVWHRDDSGQIMAQATQPSSDISEPPHQSRNIGDPRE